jgi:hypothetical protein
MEGVHKSIDTDAINNLAYLSGLDFNSVYNDLNDLCDNAHLHLHVPTLKNVSNWAVLNVL